MEPTALALENARLSARLAEVEALLAEVQEANRRLEDILRQTQREKFGKSSEKLSPDQFDLPLEDVELAHGMLEAALRAAKGMDEPRKPARNRGHLPPHLPRVERVIEPASAQCPCGCGEMAKIGEDGEAIAPLVQAMAERTAGRDSGPIPGAGDAAAEVRA